MAPDPMNQKPRDRETYTDGGEQMTPTNETDEAYRRRQEILKESTYILSQPKETKFQWRWRYREMDWFDCDPSWTSWDFLSRVFRIKPTPTRVLRPWVQIYQIESQRKDRTFMTLAVIASVKDGIDKLRGKTREEIDGGESFPDEWFTEKDTSDE